MCSGTVIFFSLSHPVHRVYNINIYILQFSRHFINFVFFFFHFRITPLIPCEPRRRLEFVNIRFTGFPFSVPWPFSTATVRGSTTDDRPERRALILSSTRITTIKISYNLIAAVFDSRVAEGESSHVYGKRIMSSKPISTRSPSPLLYYIK